MSWPDVQELPELINLRCDPFGSQPPVPSSGWSGKTVQVYVSFLFASHSTPPAIAIQAAATKAGWQNVMTPATPVPAGLHSYDGSLVSLGGNSMDLAAGDAAVGFIQVALSGDDGFGLFESLAFRNKDVTASARLESQ
jgi:hypothetical protein